MSVSLLASSLLATSAAAQIPGKVARPPRGAIAGAAAQVRVRPSVVDSGYPVAAALLARLDITVVARDSVGIGQPGIVLRQIPPAGTIVRSGAVDTLIVARALPTPGVSYLPVPNVVGSPYPRAVVVVRKGGFVPVGPTMSTQDSARAFVESQTPSPTERARAGARIVLGVRIDTRTTVPTLVGGDIDRARALLKNALLELGQITQDFDDRYSAGVVVHQDPEQGASVERGSTVAVQVSRGPHPVVDTVTIPRLVGLPLESAAQTLQRAQLRLVHVDSAAVRKGVGVVVTQRPAAGTISHRGDAVAVTVGVRPSAVVPNLLERSRDAAATALVAVGLNLGAVRFAVDSARPDNVVIAQSLPSGTPVAPGSVIDVVVNRLPPDDRVAMPNVRTMRYPDAVNTLLKLGLSAGEPSFRPADAALEGSVLDQNPEPGTMLHPGSAVDLVVAGRAAPPQPTPDSTVMMPAVVDSPVDAALRRLDTLGLRDVGVDSAAPRGTVVAWVTDSQAPSAGERVLPATHVWLKARAVETMRVPNLMGMTEDQADIEARSAGFALHVAGHVGSLRFFKAAVATQSPAPALDVALGTTIVVTIADPVPPLASGTVAFLILIAGAGVIYRWRRTPPSSTPPPTPTLRTSVSRELSTVDGGSEGKLVHADVTLRTERGSAHLALIDNQAGFILEDRILHQ